jgi:hypothetical protein
VNKLTLLGATALFGAIALISNSLLAQSSSTPPYQKSEFAIPDQYKNQIVGYPNNWRRLSGYEYSALHWEQFVVVYINKHSSVYAGNHLEFMRVFEEDLDPEEDDIHYQPYPVGTILLKESFLNEDSRPGQSLLLAGMIKREAGYDSEFGDWEYFQSAQNGQLLINGNSKSADIRETCVSCHSNIQEKDFVFATQYSMSPH